MEHAAASASVIGDDINRGKDDEFAVEDACVFDEAAAMARSQAVDLPVEERGTQQTISQRRYKQRTSTRPNSECLARRQGTQILTCCM